MSRENFFRKMYVAFLAVSVITCGLLFTSCGSTGASGTSSTPSSACNKFWRAVVKKDYQTAAKYIYDTSYTDEEKAERIGRQLSEGGVILLKYEIQDEQISADGKTAKITCKLTAKVGDREEEQIVKIPAIKTESAGWKLEGF